MLATNLIEIRIPKKFSVETDGKFLRNPNLNEISLRRDYAGETEQKIYF